MRIDPLNISGGLVRYIKAVPVIEAPTTKPTKSPNIPASLQFLGNCTAIAEQRTKENKIAPITSHKGLILLFITKMMIAKMIRRGIKEINDLFVPSKLLWKVSKNTISDFIY